MKIKEIWFDTEHIYGRDEEGREYSQSLLWYPKLRTATDEERAAYTFGFDGIHWRRLDEDISFESFTYDDTEPTPLQRFFLTHKEILHQWFQEAFCRARECYPRPYPQIGQGNDGSMFLIILPNIYHSHSLPALNNNAKCYLARLKYLSRRKKTNARN